MEAVTWSGWQTDALIERALALLDSPGRTILGIAGAPASGKSTLAEILLAELNRLRPGAAVGVGMDAFHIGHRVLVRRGLTGVKGAPETFDPEGYRQLLLRIRREPGPVYAPEFVRDIEDSLAHVIEIGPEARLIVTEGNYLLLPIEPWAGVRALLDEAWFVHLDPAERQRRMVARHEHHGHDPESARTRAYGTDERNAQLVDREQNSPDLWIEHTFSPGR